MTVQTSVPKTVTLQRDAEGQFFEIPLEFEFSGEQVWMAKTTLGLLMTAQFEPSEAYEQAVQPPSDI